jgi:uridine monophosphate synthetase
MKSIEHLDTLGFNEPSRSPFLLRLERKWQQGKFVCVGLDSEYSQIPSFLKKRRSVEGAMVTFNKKIVDATYDLVCAYKVNSAFYEQEGEQGIRALKKTIAYIKDRHPDITVILDAKRGDIGSTNAGYARFAFDFLGADAVTVHPYLGKEALAPFLARKDKGIIVLARTSNPGAGEFQDLPTPEGPLYEVVASRVASNWNTDGNLAVVVGATYPEELARARSLVGNMPILIPGIGVQGGDLEATILSGQSDNRQGMMINSSRGIIFASKDANFAAAARRAVEDLNGQIRTFRERPMRKEPSSHPERLTKTQETLLTELFRIGAIKFGNFRLKLHETHPDAPLSPIYIDLRILRRFPEVKKVAIAVYEELMRPLQFDLVADIPTAATPLAASLSERLNVGMITPRMDAKAHGTGAKIDGLQKEDVGKRVMLIDDLVTQADSKLEAIQVLEHQGMIVRDIIVLIDRQQGGTEQLASKGYTLHAACTLSQMLSFYLRTRKITNDQYNDIRARLAELTKFMQS